MEISNLLDLINEARTGKKFSRSGITHPGPYLATGLLSNVNIQCIGCEIKMEVPHVFHHLIIKRDMTDAIHHGYMSTLIICKKKKKKKDLRSSS